MAERNSRENTDTVASVRPKAPFWFRPDTETETENWP